MLRKLSILLALVVLGAGASSYWLWRQATLLPDWYVDKPSQPSPGQTPPPVLTGTDVDEIQERQAIRANLEKKVSRSLTPLIAPAAAESLPLPSRTARPGTHNPEDKTNVSNNTHTVELDADTFNELVLTSIPSTSTSQPVLQAVKAINTEIVDGELKTGFVIDPNQIPMDKLPAQYRTSLQKTFQTFPFLKQQEVYIGLVGQPRLVSGRVVLEEDTQVQLGNITLPLVEVTDRLGIPLNTLEQRINLQVGQLTVKDINFSEQKAVLKGAVD